MSRNLLAVLGCAAVLLVLPSMTRADDNDNIAQSAGPFEATLGGSGTNDKDFHNGGFNLDGSLGYYVTPNIEVSGRDTVSYFDLGTGHTWTNAVHGAVDFNFNFDRVQPYVGANVGYLDGTDIRGTGEAAPEAGLKVYVSHSAFIFGQIEYDFLFNSSSTTFNNGEFNYLVGIGFRF